MKIFVVCAALFAVGQCMPRARDLQINPLNEGLQVNPLGRRNLEVNPLNNEVSHHEVGYEVNPLANEVNPLANEGCVCGANYEPYCGDIGNGVLKTFSNRCMARCSGARRASKGTCEDLFKNGPPVHIDRGQPNCGCRRNFDPVCDSVGTVFNNNCMAQCYGVFDASYENCYTVSHHGRRDQW